MFVPGKQVALKPRRKRWPIWATGLSSSEIHPRLCSRQRPSWEADGWYRVQYIVPHNGKLWASLSCWKHDNLTLTAAVRCRRKSSRSWPNCADAIDDPHLAGDTNGGFVKSATVAFWDAYLKGDREARSYLSTDAVSRTSQGEAEVTSTVAIPRPTQRQ